MLSREKLGSITAQTVLLPSLDGQDRPADLQQELFLGWRRILSSIATTEGYEAILLAPLASAYKQSDILNYLKRHAEDEERHAEYIKDYLKTGFAYEKQKATISDILFYQNLIPIVGKLVKHLPMIGITLLYSYEKFSLKLYNRLREKAREHGLRDLEHILERISRDEGYHIAGLELLKQITPEPTAATKFLYQILLPVALWIVRMDLYMGRFSLHNRELMAHLRKLGIDPILIDRYARESVGFAKQKMLKPA